MATVQDAVTAYAAVEQHLRKAQKELLKISDTYKGVYDEGLFGYLEYLSRTAAIKSLVGEIATVEHYVVESHIDDYERAVELGIDVGPATGGDDIGILGGGPR